MKKILIATAATVALVGFAGAPQSADKKTLAFVVNGASDFWKLAEAGVEEGAGRAAELRPAVQISRAGGGRRSRRR